MDIGLHNIHRIAVISDTHGLIRPQVREKLAGCEVILHGGDINRQAILDELARICLLYTSTGPLSGMWRNGRNIRPGRRNLSRFLKAYIIREMRRLWRRNWTT